MLGGGGIGEHEASAVTGGGGIEEQATAVFGGGGTDEQDASAVAGGGGIEEHEASAVFGGGGIGEHEATAVTGAGGIAEHEASAVTGGGGIEEQPRAVLGGGGISDPERAGRRALADAASLAPDSISLWCGRWPVRSLPRRPKTTVLAHRPFPPRAPLRPPPGAAADWQPGTVDSGAFSGPAGRRVGRPARRLAGHLARAAGEVIAGLVR